jgi:N-acetylglucosamine kinase-like BadF-type ATPase
MSYYIGVDGGGTKTVFLLFDENGNSLQMLRGLGSNHENLSGGFEEAGNRIFDGVQKLLKEQSLTLNQVDGFCMGLAGLDHEWQHQEMEKRLKAFGIEHPVLMNDGYLPVYAGTQNGIGIGYNAGTGNCCNAVDKTGKSIQLGGLGDYTGDLGNGPWIAEAVYRAIYETLYLDKPDTMLKQKYFDVFSLNSREEFLASVSLLEGKNRKKNLPIVISLFFDALNQSDLTAQKIAEEMAQNASDRIAALARQLDFGSEPVEVVLSGSIHTKLPSGRYVERVTNLACQKSKKKLSCKILSEEPVTGCVMRLLGKKALIKTENGKEEKDERN